jgi:hypothetical protein
MAGCQAFLLAAVQYFYPYVFALGGNLAHPTMLGTKLPRAAKLF